MATKLQITASKVGLLLECQRPFDPEVELDPEEIGEGALYGTEFHRLMARMREGHRDAVVGQMGPHLKAAWECLQKWLGGDNEWGKFEIVSGEQPLASRFLPAGRAHLVFSRHCDFQEEGHHYDLKPGEIGGTPDLLARRVKVAKNDPIGDSTIFDIFAVIDYKTGSYEDYSNPKTPQMLTLALQTGADIVAILHTPPGGLPVVYARQVTREELIAHAKRIQKARHRIGDGSMRPGGYCRWCPAKGSCPTQVGELIQKTTALAEAAIGRAGISADTMPDLGRFLPMATELEKLLKVARDFAKEEVRNGAVIERADGKVYTLQTVTRESLSKSSVVEALGKTAGEKEIDRLRELGVIKTTTYEELRAK
jgi:hypothetical protein